MNQYKLDWYLATQSVSNYVMNRVIASEDARTQDFYKTAADHYIEDLLESAARGVMVWAVPEIMKHLAQNQIKGKLGIMGRVGGRVGLRAVPVLGTLMIVKDAYDLYQWISDA